MMGVVAVCCGFSGARTRQWLISEGLMMQLTRPELDVIEGRGPRLRKYMMQIEGMWALAWALGLISHLDHGKECSDSFVAMLPDIKAAESATAFRARVSLRSTEELVQELDLEYCLHWIVREAALQGRRPPAHMRADDLIERRRALEWLMSECEWDEVDLDT
jgi:hypothetical protein